jgi:hypothetical protein
VNILAAPAVVAWRKEKRDAARASLEPEKLQFENTKLRKELEKQPDTEPLAGQAALLNTLQSKSAIRPIQSTLLVSACHRRRLCLDQSCDGAHRGAPSSLRLPST